MSQFVTNLGTSGATFTLAGEMGSRPEPPPRGLINTRAQQTRAGWVGQVIVDREIVHETRPVPESEDAVAEVNAFVVWAVKRLFQFTPPPDIEDVVEAARTEDPASEGDL